jgi:hypothetical protein
MKHVLLWEFTERGLLQKFANVLACVVVVVAAAAAVVVFSSFLLFVIFVCF